MNLEALISALVPGRAKSGTAAAPEAHPGLPQFQDWLQQAGEPAPPLPGQPEPLPDSLSHAHSAERTVSDRASRRAAELNPAASSGAIAFAERPLLVETFLLFGEERPGLSPPSDLSDIRWIGDVLRYRIADFLRGWSGGEHAGWPGWPLAPSPGHSDQDRRTNPGDKRLPIFSMVLLGQTAGENSPPPAAESNDAAENGRTALGRRDYPAGALAARLMEHLGRMLPNGPLVHLQPEQDGNWRLFLRLPKLSDGALAELGEELKNLMNAFGLKLGTFEIVETQKGEPR